MELEIFDCGQNADKIAMFVLMLQIAKLVLQDLQGAFFLLENLSASKRIHALFQIAFLVTKEAQLKYVLDAILVFNLMQVVPVFN